MSVEIAKLKSWSAEGRTESFDPPYVSMTCDSLDEIIDRLEKLEAVREAAQPFADAYLWSVAKGMKTNPPALNRNHSKALAEALARAEEG